jgi:tetratricopeptide (TPR) repeat protein
MRMVKLRFPLIFPLILWTSFASAAEPCARLQEKYAGARLDGSAASLNELGMWFAQQNENACALQTFLAAVAKDHSFGEANYNAGRMYMAANDAKSAAPYLAQAVTARPESVASRVLYGEAQQALNESTQAEETYRQGLALDTQSPLLLSHLASLLAGKREYGAAIHYWQLAIAQDPKNNEYQLRLAIAFTESGQNDKAVALLKNLVASAPNFAPAYYSLGAAYTRLSQYGDAEAAYRTALKLKPDDSEAQFSLAEVLMVLLRYEEAKPLLVSYVAAHPANAQAIGFLGQTNGRLGNLSEAEAQLRRAVQLDPGSYDAQYDLGVLLLQAGNAREAVDFLKSALALRSNSSEVHFQLSKAYKALHEDALKDEQIAIIQKLSAARTDQTKAAVFSNDGMHAFTAGDMAEAAENYKKALALDPANAGVYYDLSLVYAKEGDTASEQKVLLEAEKLDPSLATVHDQLGLNYLQLGDTAKAQAEFREAIQQDPSFARAYTNLAVLLAKEGKNTEAEQLLRHATESDPSLTEAFVNLGLVLASEGKLADALRVENEALAHAPDDRTARAAKAGIEAAMRPNATP